MRIQRGSYRLILLGMLLMMIGLVGGAVRLLYRFTIAHQNTTHLVQVIRSSTSPPTSVQPIHRIVAASPIEVPAPPTPVSARFRTRREWPADIHKNLQLYLNDVETGKEIRLGDDGGAALGEARDDQYLLWYFGCEAECTSLPNGLYAHSFITGKDTFITARSSGVRPKLAGEWVAHVMSNGEKQGGLLLVTHLQTKETLTVTHELYAPLPGDSDYFDISEQLVSWLTHPSGQTATSETDLLPSAQLVIYDLALRQTITAIQLTTALEPAIKFEPMYELTAGESVVTWSSRYGYDTVTGSFFTITLRPPNWEVTRISSISPISEQSRILTWHFNLENNTQRYFQAPLLDATPSTAPCVEGQNLVQNGDLESTTDHARWQQSGSPTNLLVNDPPPGLATGGQWAIRLGRFNNAQQAIEQTVAIPSGVNGLTLTFAVRVYSWDLWGGDHLQLDLVDPMTGNSLLATPVQWTNTQLASGDWIPLQVAIQNWPGIDTPVDLVFRTQTDWAFPTDFTLDNVQLTTTCQ